MCVQQPPGAPTSMGCFPPVVNNPIGAGAGVNAQSENVGIVSIVKKQLVLVTVTGTAPHPTKTGRPAAFNGFGQVPGT